MTYQLFDSSSDVVACSSINERMVPNILLIWLDNNIDKNSINYQNTITQFQRIVNTIQTFTASDQCIDFLTDVCNEKVILIISDALCQKIVPLIHHVTQLHIIFIFCENEAKYEQWANEWPKIKGVFTQVTSICQGLEKLVRESEQNAISISFIDTSGDVASKKLDQLDSSFMYTQILKEILLTIDFEQIHFQEFIDYCRNVSDCDSLPLKKIEEFEKKYRDEPPIYWYTREYFLCSMLNRALRLMNVETILKIGFYIRDLHHDIEQLHSKQLSEHLFDSSLTVYRGEQLPKADFEQLTKTKGGLLSFNNFLSTSTDENVSSAFADPDPNDSTSVGVVFAINVDPSKSTTPFASISGISQYMDEDEILFSMHSVFRIQDITLKSECSRFYQVNLTLTCDDDEDLRVLTDRIREETFPNSIGWDRLGQVLFLMGHSDKAQQVYNMLLEKPANKSEKASIYHQLGLAKYEQGEYQDAIGYYEKSLAITQKRFPPNHPYLATSYNNIGNVYGYIDDHSKALWFHEKALEIQQQFFPSNHPDLAKHYNNVGEVYGIMRKFLKALSFHEKALEIRQNSLPPNHPDLARSYNNVGGVYSNMEKYLEALSSFEKALEIRRRSLPPNHPDLAKSYNDIGNVYGKIHEFSKALSFFEKAVEIQKISLQPTHPELAKSYSNIGLVYEIMTNHPEAHSYYERAVNIGKYSLHSNHSYMTLFKNNLDRVNRKL